MSPISPLLPRQQVPDLSVDLVDGGTWNLVDQAPENFTMVVIYRGLHCPICKGYLADLARKVDDFAKLGVEVVVLSSDTADRAAQAKSEWRLGALNLGYGLSLDKARDWGLYISSGVGKTSIGIEEPALFAEPGLFLIRPDGTLYFASVQTMPFARPGFADILQAVKFVTERGYPARGEVVDHRSLTAAE